MQSERKQASAADYEHQGFCLTPAILPQELLDRASARMDVVVAGEYETGIAPFGKAWSPDDDPCKIRKIDQSHLSDRAILELVSHPAIGEWAAAVTGARWVQVWATQLLLKPPGGSTAGNVGWHQDWDYWTNWWGDESNVFTAWVAVSDVTAESGPMHYVPGSHRWGFLNAGDFFGADHEAQRERIPVPEGESWREAAAILPPGGIAFHHRLTIHGSGPNLSALARRSFAIHLRTEDSRPVAGSAEYYVSHLDDPIYCPVIYGG